MSEVVTDFVKKYVAEYGTLPYSADRATDPQPTEAKPATAGTTKRGKTSKGGS